MWMIFYLFVFCLAVNATVHLPINPHAKLASAIQSITHNQVERLVTIHMNDTTFCPRPNYRVRLSGTSLYILDLVKRTHNNSSEIQSFSYPHLLDVGTYYLEVLVFLCEFINANAYADMCLQDPQLEKNILTLPYSFTVGTEELKGGTRPRWILGEKQTNAFLPTRYQRNNCSGASYCMQQPEDVEQYGRYVWTDKPAYTHLVEHIYTSGLQQLHNVTRTGHETLTFCMIGASHSRELTANGNNLHIKHVHFVNMFSQFPFQFDASLLEDCSYAVIGYGQWPLSHLMADQHAPYTATQYEEGMTEVFARIKRAQSKVMVFTRSINPNGMGRSYTKCPCVDFRTPPYVNIFNHILRNVSNAHGIEHIDSSHVQGPFWDGALDWSHCPAHVFTAEIEAIVSHVLSYSHKHQHFPPIGLNTVPRSRRSPDNALVRFSDANDTVYLYAGGVMRPFMDEHTIRFLLLNVADSVLYNASRRKEFVFGPTLHHV